MGLDLKTYKQHFIELSRSCEALSFGSFTLKSGRNSPYFFNAGKFSSGASLSKLGRCYAHCIVDSGLRFDMLLGPAYKGIPLVTATSIALSEEHNINVPIAYNRKEHKTHGEGGVLVGSPLIGRVLVVDDVITAGTAIRETLRLIFDAKADLAGVAVGIDREERGIGDTSAVQEIENDFKTTVLSMIGLGDLVNYLEHTETNDKNYLLEMQGYRARYGVIKNS